MWANLTFNRKNVDECVEIDRLFQNYEYYTSDQTFQALPLTVLRYILHSFL